jgi:hypothetical protein
MNKKWTMEEKAELLMRAIGNRRDRKFIAYDFIKNNFGEHKSFQCKGCVYWEVDNCEKINSDHADGECFVPSGTVNSFDEVEI